MSVHNGQRDRLIYPVSLVVLLGWSTSLVASLVTQDFTALTITTPVMLLLAGYVFGVAIVRKEGTNGKA